MFAICWLTALIFNMLVRFGEFNVDKIKVAPILTVTIAKFTYVLNQFLHHKMLKVPRPTNRGFPTATLRDGRRIIIRVNRAG